MSFGSVFARACGIVVMTLSGGCEVVDSYFGGPAYPPEIEVLNAALSPDGTTVVAAFRFHGESARLAVIPLDQAKADVAILKTPEGFVWSEPVWSPDGQFIVAVGSCSRLHCTADATVKSIWRLRADGSEATLISHAASAQGNADVERQDPQFGADAAEIFWVEGAPLPPFDSPAEPEVPPFLTIAPIPPEPAPRRIVRWRDGKEDVIWPDEAHGIAFSDLNINASLAGEDWFLVGKVHTGSRHPVVTDLDSGSRRFRSFLFRVSDGAVSLEQPFGVVDAFMRQDGNGFAYAAQFYGDDELRQQIYLSSSGETRLLLERSRGRIWDLTLSDDLEHVVFVSQLYIHYPTFVWHYDVERDVLERLPLPERLGAAMRQLVAQGAAEAS